MKYVDLGKVEATSYRRKKEKKAFKSYKVLLGAVLLVFIGYLLYSFKPMVEKGLNALLEGPSVVFSFFRNDPSRLDQSNGRTNFLLIGIDKRSQVPYSYQGSGGEVKKNGFLADTIILGSYKHEDSSVVLFSIPRDLWVEVPAFGGASERYTKINTTYSIGDLEGYSEGGLGLTKDVVSSILGIPVHYSFRIDFDGFQRGIDLLGGIEVEVENTFDDYMYPREGYENAPDLDDRYMHVHFDAGLQYMDGETALQFVRSRHALGVEGSDFARAARQQKVLLAVREKALSLSWIDDFSKIKDLYSTFGEMIETSAPISDYPLFLTLIQRISVDQIQNYVLGNVAEMNDGEEILYNPPTEQFGGAWVLIPRSGDWFEIQDFIDKVLFPEETDFSEEN